MIRTLVAILRGWLWIGALVVGLVVLEVVSGLALRASDSRAPREIDGQVSRLKLETLGVAIDTLTPEQERYLASWSEGT